MENNQLFRKLVAFYIATSAVGDILMGVIFRERALLDASVIINLTTIPSSIQGYIGFGLSWLAVLYFTKTLGARFGLVYFTR